MLKNSGERHRAKLIDAAAKIIREEGVAVATTRRISVEAGVSLGSLHYHFDTKQQLFEAVSETFGATGKEWVARHIQPKMGVATAAGVIGRAFATWAARTPEDQLTEFELGIWALRTDIQFKLPQDAYQDWLCTYMELLSAATQDDEPPRDLDAIARSLVALVDGFIIQDHFLRETALPTSADRLIDALVRAIEGGFYDL